MAERHTASARVTVTVDVAVTDGWGPECTVSQVYKQAADVAANRIRALAKEGLTLIGQPKVTAVLVPQDR
jgi:transcription elongation GreA/GreB family factor